MIYSWQPTPLHAARPAVGSIYCGVLLAAAVLAPSPLLLGGLLVAVLIVAKLAHATTSVLRAVRFACPLAVLITLLNPLFSQEGETLLAHGLWLPLIGSFDVTFESVVYGALLGLRVLVIAACFALYAAAVDPDGVLRLFRRLSFSSALTAVLATRMVPILAGDASRVAEAQRCRSRRSPKLAVFRAVTASALERSVDVAATLELRGYSSRTAVSKQRQAYSRHDRSFAIAAVLVFAAVLLALIVDSGFAVYPQLHFGFGLAQSLIAAIPPLVAAAPFVDRKGVG